MLEILTQSNHKQLTAGAFGWAALSLMLEPNYTDKASGVRTCPDSGLCAAVCLSKCGRNKYDVSRAARLRRTELFFSDRERFLKLLVSDIAQHRTWALKKKLKPAIRLNALSDLPWEDSAFPFNYFHDVQFYDYTKSDRRARAFANKKFPSNYHLTYSISEKTEPHFPAWLSLHGVNSSLVMHIEHVQEVQARGLVYFNGHRFRYIDGDEHDLRFLDPRGMVVLKYKTAYLPNSGERVSSRVIERVSGFLNPHMAAKVS